MHDDTVCVYVDIVGGWPVAEAAEWCRRWPWVHRCDEDVISLSRSNIIISYSGWRICLSSVAVRCCVAALN